MSLGIYLFCLTPADPLPKIAGKGIDGEHPLFVEVIGEVAAVLAEVHLEDFTGPESQAKMEDLTWVAPRALRHEEVVLSAMEQGPVLPVRFGTVFSSIEAAAEPLRQRQDVLMKFFQETIDKKEWTMKGYVDRPQARARMTAARLAAEKEQLAGLSPGKRYFLEQKIKGAVDKDVAKWLKEMGRDILRVAREASAGFSECRLQSQDVTGRDEEMFFHGALLVPDGSMAALERMTDEWNTRHEAQGLSLELSGPWPPYHFAPVL
ncbi:MAG: GvpL/GvpF family gas vesicle protein [Proteobacteria bacterium]|nr:GvpL/GvpF family gas vesicle protein [Pseudomonadota bacterium]